MRDDGSDFFDTTPPRRGTHSVKWDMAGDENLLPMWVADMDFKTAPAILEAIQKRVAHGVFGYTLTPDDFFDAIIAWWSRRHQVQLQREWILPVAGILPALSAIIRAFSEKGDQVLLLTPVYDHFFATIRNCGLGVIESPLKYQSVSYAIDFDDFEKKAAHPATKFVLLSNPHNPTGRVWTREELSRIAAICLRHGVLVVSDEIHADLVHHPFRHCPFAALGEAYAKNVVTCCSPSKSFNLAGIQVGYLFSENEKIRQSVEAVLQMQDTVFLNVFAAPALVAAYRESEGWLELLKDYIYQNYLFLKNYMALHLPSIQVTPLEATYLVWLDIRSVNMPCAEFTAALHAEQQLWLNPGTMYGETGEGFLRMNIGCPRPMLEDGLERLRLFVNKN